MGVLGAGALELGKKVAEAVGESIDLPVSVAISVVDVLKSSNDSQLDASCERAREVLKCTHIEVMPSRGYHPATVDMLNWVTTKKSVAFLFDGFALGHPTQADLDVKAVSTRVYRWNKRTKQVEDGYSDMHVRPCSVCAGLD
jgi:hypothetical protein